VDRIFWNQTAIANPHVTLHYKDPDNHEHEYPRAAEVLPPEPKEIKAAPVRASNLGMLMDAAQKRPKPTTILGVF